MTPTTTGAIGGLTPNFWLGFGLTIAMTALFMLAEHRQHQALRWIAKPLASLAFVGTGIAAGALESRYGVAVLVALVLSAAGDVLLIPKSFTWFRLGLASFLLGHVAYGVAFVLRGISPPGLLAALVILVPVSLATMKWLMPHVKRDMRKPVVAYTLVITIMVALAAATVAAKGAPIVLAAAVSFYLSDLSVARDRFVKHSFVNRAWGLPAYYGAQLLFALGLALGVGR
ncbi:lysoplasmalogenase [Myxococcota bacterium]|nr:lysoplasmalogenase [Myxococcota bacterium]